MKTLRIISVFLIVILSLSCERKAVVSQEEMKQINKEKVYQKIINAGFDKKNIVEYDTYYLVEGDIMFYKNDTLTSKKLKQARTNYIVDVPYRPRNIKIYLQSNSFYWLNLEPALDEAIMWYNQAYLGLTFSKVNTFDAADIVIEHMCPAGACAMAGFPDAAGNPFKFIYVCDGFLKDNNITHLYQLTYVVVHEMGHCLGLRHTNWAEVGEEAGPEGAITIDGTGSNDASSVMNASACGTYFGGFSTYDLTALRTMYPQAE